MNPGNTLMSRLEPLWMLPLASLSFAFYRTVKPLVGALYRLSLLRAKHNRSEWQTLGDEGFERNSMLLPFVMTSAPRWNTHAIVATVGPIKVKRSLTIETASATRSAGAWSIVVSRFPSYKPINSVHSFSHANSGDWHSLELPGGNYLVTVRLYDCGNQVEYPAMKADDADIVGRKVVSGNVNDFYRRILGRQRLHYLLLHYYVFALLRFKRWFPEAFVKRQFLPMANPGTRFYFGCIEKYDSVRVEVEPAFLETGNLFFTLYNRASFPICWHQITRPTYVCARSVSDGFYLLRVVSKDFQPKPITDDSIKIAVQYHVPY